MSRDSPLEGEYMGVKGIVGVAVTVIVSRLEGWFHPVQ
jgi:hypothetical protein